MYIKCLYVYMYIKHIIHVYKADIYEANKVYKVYNEFI